VLDILDVVPDAQSSEAQQLDAACLATQRHAHAKSQCERRNPLGEAA
jgi:hypothetical protein